MKTKKEKTLNIFLQMKEKFMQRRVQMMFASLSCAFVLSALCIGVARMEIGGTSLMASVSELASPTANKMPDFSADIGLIEYDDGFFIVAGKKMENVDFIEGIIAFNPQDNVILTSTDTNTILVSESEGRYRFHISLGHSDVDSGTTVTTIHKNHPIASPISFLDAQFVSEGERYNLSNIVK